MLVERGTQVMNVEPVSDAYAIAANYLRKSGAIPDTLVTNERLLEIIVKLLQRGELNKIRLANKAIAVRSPHRPDRITASRQRRPWKPPSTASCRPMTCLRTDAAANERRDQGNGILTTLIEAGEKDTHRLTVCGLTYLRQLDGSSDQVKAGYTGL